MDWLYALALLLVGYALIALDVLVTPGVDLLGLLGLLTVAAAVVLAYVRLGVTGAVVVGAVGLIGTVGLLRLLFRSRHWRQLVLQSSVSERRGFSAGHPEQSSLVGQTGWAITPLRPSGRARFGEQHVDVVTDGGFAEPGTLVTVIAVNGNRVVVQPAPAADQDPISA